MHFGVYGFGIWCEPPETRLSQTGILDSFGQTEKRYQQKTKTQSVIPKPWEVYALNDVPKKTCRMPAAANPT